MYQTVNDIRNYFLQELADNNYVVDRSGSKTIELIGASFLADEPAIFGTPNQEYIDAELAWYDSQSTNVNTLAEIYGKSPVAWQMSANKHGEINSNYGYLIYSDKHYNQFLSTAKELLANTNSRRATMVYTRPSIWKEYNEDGKNDFICTNAVTYYVRDGELHCVVQMRSNDVIFGYRNDYAWQSHVLEFLSLWLFERGVNVKPGNIYWQVQNLHVYERHFDMVK